MIARSHPLEALLATQALPSLQATNPSAGEGILAMDPPCQTHAMLPITKIKGTAPTMDVIAHVCVPLHE